MVRERHAFVLVLPNECDVGHKSEQLQDGLSEIHFDLQELRAKMICESIFIYAMIGLRQTVCFSILVILSEGVAIEFNTI